MANFPSIRRAVLAPVLLALLASGAGCRNWMGLDPVPAKAVGAHFYPTNPANEDASWERFFREACDRFLASNYGGEYEQALVAEFESYLPDQPPWHAAKPAK